MVVKMINGRNLDDELKRIEEIFDGLSLQEFDDMMKRNGYNENEKIPENSRAFAIQRENELRMLGRDIIQEKVKYKGYNKYKRKTNENALFTIDRNRTGAA